MRHMLPIIAGGILAVLVLAVLFVALQQAEFRITRSATISAPAELVFAQVNDFHNWPAWSPWEKIDPDLKRSYEGAPLGSGAVYCWEGNKKVGAGRMTVTESRPNSLIKIRLEFLRPFKATNNTEFTFLPENNRTAVTWTMSGRNGFMAKAFNILMNM